MNKIELKPGNYYIFKERTCKSVRKAEIVEITTTTYLIEWEGGFRSRWMKEEFNFKFEPIELL